MRLGGLALGLLLTATFAMTASAAISFDGNLDAQDDWAYTAVSGNDLTIADNLDIATVAFDKNDTWFYMGVSVWDGPLDTNGGAESLLGMTGVYAQFANGLSHQLGVILDNGNVVHVLLDGMQLDAADYEVALGQSTDVGVGGIEVAISRSLLDLTDFSWVVQIDDMGLSFDDYAAGTAVGVPEPTTLAVLGLGGLVALRRRR